MPRKKISEAATGKCSVKKAFYFSRPPYCGYWLPCSELKGYSHRRSFVFSQLILREIRAVSLSQVFRCSVARNKSRTGALPRIFESLSANSTKWSNTLKKSVGK